MCIRRQRNVPALLHIGINQRTIGTNLIDSFSRCSMFRSHLIMTIMKRRKNNIYYICFFVLLIIKLKKICVKKDIV